VDGTDNSGKTLLIQQYLKSNRSAWVSVARILETDDVDAPKADYKKTAELERISTDSVFSTMVYRYPPSQRSKAYEEFWDTTFIEEPTDAVFLEGAADFGLAPDLHIFVTRPLAKNESLLRQDEIEIARLDVKGVLEFLTGIKLDEVEMPDDEIEDDENLEFSDDEIIEETITEIPDSIAEVIREAASGGYPLKRKGWFLPDTHQGLKGASMVIINIMDEAETEAARQLSEEIRRMHKEEEIIRDLSLRTTDGRRLTVFIANLANPKDSELKRAVARIKRVIRENSSPHGSEYEENNW